MGAPELKTVLLRLDGAPEYYQNHKKPPQIENTPEAGCQTHETVLKSVKMGPSSKQHPTNGKTLDWYKGSLKNGKVSEEMFKNEAITFFKLSAEQSTKSKAEFKRQIEKYVTMHKIWKED